jgi:nitrilase
MHNMYVVLGVAERGPGSIWCTAVSIHPEHGTLPVHRKLVPTHEERLVWAHGDGQGLNGHDFAGARIGALNCWENWMPLARYALYADGVTLHVALWPGSVGSTEQITRFVAREGRCFVLSAGGLMRRQDIPDDFPLRDALPADAWFRNGGSCIAAPTGEWVVPPVAGERRLVVADLDLAAVGRERHNFDPTGHYARPDVFRLEVDRSARRPVHFKD